MSTNDDHDVVVQILGRQQSLNRDKNFFNLRPVPEVADPSQGMGIFTFIGTVPPWCRKTVL